MANEINLEKESGRMLSTLYENEERCRIECEELLPDYKDNINRLTAIDAKPKITSKKQYVQGSFFIIELEGTASFNVIYKSTDKSALTACVFYEDFTHTVRIPLDSPGEYDTENAAVMLTLGCDPTGSRAISERKLSLKATVSIALCVKCNRTFSYYGSGCGNIEKRLSEIHVTSLAASAPGDFSLSESITLPDEYLPCAEIIDCDAELICRSVKCTDGKIIFSSEAEICCGYRAAGENGEFISFSQPIEFTEEIECDAAATGAMSEVILTLSSLKAESDIDSHGDNRVIKLEIGYSADALVYMNESYPAVSDCYSTECKLKTEIKESRFETLASIISSESTATASFPLRDEKMVSAECIKAHLDFKKADIENNSILLEGKLNVRYISVSEDGSAIAAEENLPISLSVKPDATVDLTTLEAIRLEASGEVRDCELAVNAGEIVVKCLPVIHLRLFSKNTYPLCSCIETTSEPVAARKPLVFFYPSSGESLWDIAKLYSVSAEKLSADNSISEDRLPPVIKIIS